MHDVRSRSQEDQSGAEGAMGKGEGARTEAEENDVSSNTKEDRGGAAGKVGEGEAGGVIAGADPLSRLPGC
jgi:hypothetical protein